MQQWREAADSSVPYETLAEMPGTAGAELGCPVGGIRD